jgi:hypothetical protein
MKQSYGLDKKQAAVKALERGENLTKVSHQFQVLRAQYLNRIINLGGGGAGGSVQEKFIFWVEGARSRFDSGEQASLRCNGFI